MKDNKYIIDFREVNYYLEMHAVIWKSLDFPDYYGCNWDAFWDCLTDMYGDPVYIEIIGLDVIERKFDGAAEKMISILREFKHFANDRFASNIKIEIVDKSGRKEIR
jgi:RNAse (barnase) inhibitor barstar